MKNFDIDLLYCGEANARRIKAYTLEAEKYNIKPGTVRDIFSSGIEFALKELKEINDKEPDGDGWISVKERPLFTISDNEDDWTLTEDGDKSFMAAVPFKDEMEPGKTFWWIRHCVIEDSVLCVVGEDYNQPAGWGIEDITHFIPLPALTKE